MEVLIVVHGIIWMAIIFWLIGVVLHMRIINSSAKNAIKAELRQMVLIRESSIYAERELTMKDIDAILKEKCPESVVLSDNGVLRIQMHRNHFIVGYPSKQVAKSQMAGHLHKHYFSEEDRKAA